MLYIFVAIDENYGIGRKGDLLCHLPNDLKHFKEITSGHPVIMGRKTYMSLPRRPLPNRRNIVISQHANYAYEGAEMVNSIDEALQLVDPKEETFIIGGGSIYEQLMENADKLYITRIHHSWDDADTFSRKSKLIHGIEQRANGMIQMKEMPILIRLKNGKDCKSTSFQWRTNQFYFSQFGHQYKYLSLSFPDIS